MKPVFLFLFLLLFLISSCASPKSDDEGRVKIEQRITSALEKDGTFTETDNEVCKQDNKPIIREFGTSWCPHCKWIEKTYQNVVNDYVKQGKVVAYQWYVDVNDDLLTAELENSVPESEIVVFKKFNPRMSIPTFVFGCRFIRIGNGYEDQKDLKAEEEEFKAVIETLINS